ncbi:TerB family tellurite resistance protein [Pontibacter qinzhouensis]|uniref:TerB family tellurite resistance protein n=1 Tax=Pontibacter qinzhouensis TaxID=2603253 RepID=A0A5C8K9F4_9BACT|nr:TerB family tellurite resistance protein [Pontibacter qinzhouensis]TXK45755.1 TerB family tellurite resistance protein [Pontibacter qinzhouensis]
MEQGQTTLLKDYSQEEKAAYFGALATMASADGKTTEEELEFLQMMGEAAELPPNVQQEVVQIAQNPTIIDLRQCLDVLKKSQLRFSFITDLISFAKSDGLYSADEQKRIEQMAAYLEINQKQFSVLDQFVNKADEAKARGEDPTSSSFLNKSGFGDMFKNAGISPGMVQGMLGILAPMVIAGMMSGGRRRGGMMGGGLLGSLLGGGMMGGGMMGGGRGAGGMVGAGGLGSILSVLGGLNGRRGYGNMGGGGLGGLLGGILGGGRRGGGTGW